MYFNKKASESSDSSISLYSKSADILSKCDQMIGDYNTVVDQEKVKKQCICNSKLFEIRKIKSCISKTTRI